MLFSSTTDMNFVIFVVFVMEDEQPLEFHRRTSPISPSTLQLRCYFWRWQRSPGTHRGGCCTH